MDNELQLIDKWGDYKSRLADLTYVKQTVLSVVKDVIKKLIHSRYWYWNQLRRKEITEHIQLVGSTETWHRCETILLMEVYCTSSHACQGVMNTDR